ncbi:MAG: alpha/beta hydrolase [Phycisphaerae bacterium]
MSLCEVHFYGESIDKKTAMNVLLPDGEGPFPVLYLLHGLSDDYTTWLRRTGIERYVDDMPLMVVMPDGHRSWYCNDPRPEGLAYEDHIVRDVVGFVERTFPAKASRDARAIAGLSMGGYGAMMLAMRHPGIFSVACSHSGAVGFVSKSVEPPKDRPDKIALAEVLPAGEYDCFSLAEQLADGENQLALRLDCGTDDFLIEHNRLFHTHLEKLGVEHVYEEHPGEHNWDYWDEHIIETLAFVNEHTK